MNRGTTIFVVFCVCTVLAGCVKGADNKASVPNVVTPDIQAGIEKYIEDQTRAGKGYFRFSSDGKEYLFKLVRIHTEYLANLGPRSHFACVDLVDTRGDVYDVDFFLAGDPGAMTVTETTLHKLNGIPFYAWKQNQKGVWERTPMEGASQELLGVKTGRDEFEFNYQATLPVITTTARMWLPLPVTDAFQKVQMTIVSAPGKHRVLQEREHDNTILFFELGPKDSEKTVHIRYHVQRLEKAAYLSKDPDLKKYLKEESLVPIDDNFRTIASESVTGKKGDLVRARALYDHVIERMSYIKHGPGWGRGDAVFACNVRTGNCTDFHAYFIALARSIGIPARFAIGAAIPSSRNDGGVDGYHCWVEFHAEGKWWPVDISEADKYSSLSTYYFGHHPANRFEFSRGRDLVVEPGPVSGPINFLAYPVLEIGNQPAKVAVTFSFKRTVSGM
jgi:transglutaminase-like putative cysteine protease